MTPPPPSPFTDSEARPDRLRPLLARIWRDYLSKNKAALFTGMVCAALAGGLSALLLGLLEPAINGLFVPGGSVTLFGRLTLSDRQALIWIPVTIVGVAMLRTFALSAQSALVNRLGHGIVGDIQRRLFAAMIRADLARLRSQHSGVFVSSVLYDANLVREAFTSGIINYTQHGLTLVAVVAYMAWIDWRLTLIVMLAIPVVALIMSRFGKRTRRAALGAMAESENLSTALVENLDGVRLIKIENREAAEEARVAEVIDRRQRHVIKGANARALAGPTSDLVAYSTVAAVMGVAGWMSQSGGMNVGEFAAFIGLLLAAGQSLRQVTNLATVMSEGLTAARRLFQALDIEPEIREAASPHALPPGPATVAFDHVSFAYAGADAGAAPTLSDVSIVVQPGETVALVGPSGGGKSTILSLLPRFYDVSAGTVTINGQDLRQISLTDLRARIALVTQEPFLFDDTIAANIAYGRTDATAEQIAEAARAAAAHDFISALPQGYDTRAGESGLRLSGGQRQRIAIARAFLKDAPILLLDEATSALDTESEALVQAALERLMQGRATLMIAHRLSTVMNADRIHVIDAGRVVETGTHAELVAAGGLYSRLARQQSLDAVPSVEVVS